MNEIPLIKNTKSTFESESESKIKCNKEGNNIDYTSIILNDGICNSIKSRKNKSRCQNKSKSSKYLCGIHNKMKKPIYFIHPDKKSELSGQNDNSYQTNKSYKAYKIIDNTNEWIDMGIINNYISSEKKSKIIKKSIHKSIQKPVSKIKKIKAELCDMNRNIYSLETIRNENVIISSYKIKNIRNSIKEYNLINVINIKDSKKNIITNLRIFFNTMDHYYKNIDKIIKIQAILRGKIVRNLSYNTVNDMDFCTCQNKYQIPKKYYITYTDENKSELTYFYDIRSIYKYYNFCIKDNKTFTNPFSTNEFPIEFLDKMLSRIADLDSKCESIIHKSDILTPEQKIESMVVDLFHEIDKLDNYTDHRWFMDLDMKSLKQLYIYAEDIWNYRTQLTLEKKREITSDGNAFIISVITINNIPDSKKDDLRCILIYDFTKLITEGKTIDDKKLGAMMILTAMTGVSFNARMALPHYVQDFH